MFFILHLYNIFKFDDIYVIYVQCRVFRCSRAPIRKARNDVWVRNVLFITRVQSTSKQRAKIFEIKFGMQTTLGLYLPSDASAAAAAAEVAVVTWRIRGAADGRVTVTPILKLMTVKRLNASNCTIFGQLRMRHETVQQSSKIFLLQLL